MSNLLLKTDFYKMPHYAMYPKGTEHVYSYFESRPGAKYPQTTFFGLQHILYELTKRITIHEITDARLICGTMLGQFSKKEIEQYDYNVDNYFKETGKKEIFNMEGWLHILTRYGGRLPVRIKAVPEGLTVPVDNVLMTIENTDPKCWWLTNYLETLLSHVWYSSTVCTVSRELKKLMKTYAESSDNPSYIDFQLHDFGAA